MLNKTSLRKASASIQSFDDNQVAALMQLFKIVPTSIPVSRVISAEDALEEGLVFVSPDGGILEEIPQSVYISAVHFYGNTAKLFNQTFYKSFATVRDANPLTLLLDQIVHYFTTYGAEALGVNIPTYVPVQALEVPETMVNNKNFKFVVIQFKSNEDCVARFNKYLTSLAAPSPAIEEAVITLLPFVTLDTDDIKSFEIQVIQHQRLNTVPKNAVSQLRYLVYMTTGETLIIKNKYMRQTIQRAATTKGDTAFNIIAQCDQTRLAAIFLRYKPIFLAYKSHNKCAPLINQLRRLADTYHEPLSEASLQNLTSVTSTATRQAIINKASTRDLIKVLNSVRSRISLDATAPGVYAVRNGRTFVKEDGLIPNNNLMSLGVILHRTIVARLRDSIGGKRFYLPDYIDYTVPTSEKQFVGSMPYGTRINGTPDGAFTFGVHWFNQRDTRIDIDLHMNSATRHFGWNSLYRDGAELIYTGDQTDAPLPNGAAEAYWFTPSEDEPFIVTANLYSDVGDCEYKVFMTEQKPSADVQNFNPWVRNSQDNHYIYDPNTALFPAIPMKFNGDERSYTLGMFIGSEFYFYGGTLSNDIVPSANYSQFLDGLSAQLKTKVFMRDLIEECGGFILTSVGGLTGEGLEGVISLAPEDITVDTLFNIVDGEI